MERASIDVVCGQETWTSDLKSERWDTGEVFINFGKDFGDKTTGRSEGVCFVLNKRVAAAFEKGGKKTKKYCPRLATIRMPVSRHEQIYIVNAHAPDSGQPKARREAFQRRLDEALADCKEGETMVLAGDFNAAMGTAGENDGDDDGVVGPHGAGIAHQNEAGRALKVTAATYGLVDLVSFQKQKFDGTWMHGRSKQWHQSDKIFMRASDRSKVQKCRNAEMLVDSDHFSIRLHARCTKPPPPLKTTRQKVLQRDLESYFGKDADDEKNKEVVQKIAEKWNGGCTATGNGCENLTAAVQEVLDALPLKKRAKSGWLDMNYQYISESVDTRNAAARDYARAKTEESKSMLQEARRELKKRKKVAKNKWFLHVLHDSNDSTLPGGKDRKDSYALWTMAKKLKRGAKKWKPWLRRNIVDAAGIPATDPAGNAANFAEFYNDLFTNDVAPNGPTTALFSQMQQVATDRVWLSPTMTEMRKAVKSLRATAPASVWQAMCGSEDLEKAMLDVMIRCWVDKEVPADWRKFYMITLEKKAIFHCPPTTGAYQSRKLSRRCTPPC